MKKFNKYSYEDWWEGRVILVYACEYHCDDEDFSWDKLTLPAPKNPTIDADEEPPKIVDFVDFTDEAVLSIKQKQRELFDDGVKHLFETYTANFIKKYNASRMPKVYLEHEINQCDQIIHEELPYGKIIQLSYWDMSFPRLYLTSIHGYICDVIYYGNVFDCSSIQSPNSKYQDTTFPTAPIYAEFIFRYSEWLQANFITSKKENEIAAEEKTNKQGRRSEVHNPYPLIFIDGVAYQIFCDLKSMTVKDNTKLADYSFIYHKMKASKLIVGQVKHKTFIDFLRDYFKVDISASKFPFKDQLAKKPVFDEILRKYESKMNDSEID